MSSEILPFDEILDVLAENDGAPQSLLRHRDACYTIASWKDDQWEYDFAYDDLMEEIEWRSVEKPKGDFEEDIDEAIERFASDEGENGDDKQKAISDMASEEFRTHFEWAGMKDRQMAAKCAEWCKENANIIFSNGQVLVYDDKNRLWVRDEAMIAMVLKKLLGDQYGRNVKDEFVSGYVSVDPEFRVDWEKIGIRGPKCVVENGILNLIEGDIEREVRPEDYAIMRFPVEWESMDAETDRFHDDFLNRSVAKEDRKKLQEYAGLCLHTNGYRYKKALMMVGGGDNGKGVFEDILTALVGHDNAMHDGLKELSENRFGAHRLRQNAINVNSDIDGNKITKTSTFKKLTGRDRLRVEAKFEEPFEIENPAKLIFAANQVPKVKNGDLAFYNRWMFVHFPTRFTSFDNDGFPDKDPDIAEDIIQNELSGVLAWAVSGYQRLREQGQFTGEHPGEEVREMWFDYADPTATFVDNYVSFGDGGHEEIAPTPTLVSEMYEYYKKYISTTPTAPETKQTLSSYIRNRYEDAKTETSRDVANSRDLDVDTVRYWNGVHLSHEAREDIRSLITE